ncbi:MAG TPA: VOC family protein [Polyangia bacterium]|jgi:catechol 2,3-dioxygenase-like lactoylglutathione lyase family enzyme|nr:VOC family protein [Polyangia bacterium]
MTLGFDHVGLTVADLEASRRFFVECLGWKVVGERPAYPAVYVSDGRAVVTLWRVENAATFVAFDRRKNVGLHHLALKVADRAALDAVHARVAQWQGVTIEFAPEPSGNGPKVHMMIREPGGNRIEFSWDPR